MATESVIFSIAGKEGNIPQTPIPKPTETTTSDCAPIVKGSGSINAHDGTYVKANGEFVELWARDDYKGWRSWEQNAIGLKEAKAANSPEVLVHQMQGRGYQDIWRFGTDKNSALYYSYIPGEPPIEIGPCWKKVKELGRSKYFVEGNTYEIKKQVIYILKK